MQYKQVDGTRQNLPKSWTLKDGTQTGNFDLLPESVHNDEGWFQCEDDPAVNTPETHKLGGDYLVENKWTRAVVPMTQEDKDAYQLVQDSFVRLAELEAELAASAFKGLTTQQAKDYSDATAVDAAGIQKVLRKIVGALMSLHPHEL